MVEIQCYQRVREITTEYNDKDLKNKPFKIA